jgi:type IV pilus assembly protein PilM
MTRLLAPGGTPGPDVAVEVAAHHVSAAAVEGRPGRPVVAVFASEPLPAGAIVPSLTARNVVERDAAAAALDRVLERVGRPRRVGLIIPDPVAKVSFVRFAQVPPRAADLERLIRWQVRKSAPFAIEQAQVSYSPGLHGSEGTEFVVSLARRDIIEEYEQLCAAAGAHPGIVDLATFNVVNAVMAASTAPSGDWLLVNVRPDYASIAILRGGDLVFFRNRGADAEGTLADLIHQTAMYYEDRLRGQGLARVLLSGATGENINAADVGQARREVESRLGRTVEIVDPRAVAVLADRISAAPALLDTLAPLVGLLLREEGAA